jgi:hypothetical protein
MSDISLGILYTKIQRPSNFTRGFAGHCVCGFQRIAFPPIIHLIVRIDIIQPNRQFALICQ